MKNRMLKLRYSIGIILTITIVLVIVLTLNNINKRDNLVDLVNINWNISLPNAEKEEILQRDSEQLFEGKTIEKFKYRSCDIENIKNKFSWIEDKDTVNIEMKKCNKIIKSPKTNIESLVLSKSNIKLFFKYEKNGYLILILDEIDNSLSIIMESY